MTPPSPHQPDPLAAHIDRTLHALAHPPSPTGLDRRILATLATRQAAPAPTRPFTLRYPLTFAAAALLLLLATLRHLHHPHPQPSATAPSTLASQPAAEPQPPTPIALPTARPRIHLQLALQTAQPPTPNPNQQALADLHTPSFPAPPLPPTPQERLVRLMLRRGEIHDLAQLNPAELAAAATGERADFHNFFEPPLPSPLAEPAPPATAPTTNPQNQGDPQ